MIDEKNFIQRALKSYDNPQCVSVDEFKSDLDRFSSIKKSITKYRDGAELNERLILNHLVICFNIFGSSALLFLLYRIDQKNWPVLFPFLMTLNRLPEHIPEHKIDSVTIELDQVVVNRLKNL